MRLNKAELLEWQSDPRTQEVFKYLSDWRDQLAENYKESFLAGCVISEQDQIANHAICQAIEDIIGLEFTTLETFYQEEDDETPKE